jgi:RNase P subunit RPR2
MRPYNKSIIDMNKQSDKIGRFNCPHCGTLISPEDMGQENYTILETFCEEDGTVVVMVICRCGEKLRLEFKSPKKKRRAGRRGRDDKVPDNR